jgi:hypothetical protein
LSTGDASNGGHVGVPASVHSQQQVHTPQLFQQHQAVNEYYLHQQQQKMMAAQQQQMSQQMQGQRQASAQQQLAAQQQASSAAQSADNKAFPQLSDFADDALGDAVDLAVYGISSEGVEDFDLDSIEPMRCLDHGGVQHEHGGQNISQQMGLQIDQKAIQIGQQQQFKVGIEFKTFMQFISIKLSKYAV